MAFSFSGATANYAPAQIALEKSWTLRYHSRNTINHKPINEMKSIASSLFKCVALAGFLSFCIVGNIRAADVAQSSALRVACVGDSITFGATITNRNRDSYPAQLGKFLGAGYDVRNFGHNGATLLHRGNLPYIKQKEHDNALAFTPDIVVILLGTNDSKHRGDGSLDSGNAPDVWQYKADFVPDYEALIAEFRKANPSVKIYVCLPTPCFPGRWGINDKTIHDEIIPLVQQIAKDTGANIIDLNTPFAGKPELISPDTVHPNAAGAKLMAKIIYTAIK
ncbi:MAG TPA: GDSL-type esterase/lipase family protein [Verrucomicrobiae bacterium]|nr:GDSL-type esterase/lipase family protein [Verrucomicrobiae bacterium]